MQGQRGGFFGDRGLNWAGHAYMWRGRSRDQCNKDPTLEVLVWGRFFPGTPLIILWLLYGALRF